MDEPPQAPAVVRRRSRRAPSRAHLAVERMRVLIEEGRLAEVEWWLEELGDVLAVLARRSVIVRALIAGLADPK